MMNNDETAIFESYRNQILNQKIISESMFDDEPENDSESMFDDEGSEGSDDSGDEIREIEKINFVVKNEEIGTRLDPVLRAIIRKLPEETKDTDILHEIKMAIQEFNDEAEGEERIELSPLKMYDVLKNYGAISEEERTAEPSDDDEIPLMQSMDDDISDDGDDDLGKFGKRSDFETAMRRDVERGELEDDIRRMGTDWRSSDEDFRSSNY
jgi:hypothetical protein